MLDKLCNPLLRSPSLVEGNLFLSISYEDYLGIGACPLNSDYKGHKYVEGRWYALMHFPTICHKKEVASKKLPTPIHKFDLFFSTISC
jgi:hypothetical protein